MDFVKFPLILFIVALHCYTAVRIGNDCWWHLVYPFLTIGEIGVPSFFFISGYLYFFNVSDGNLQYKRKTKSRIKTLLIPYILWNTLMLLLDLALQSNPVTGAFFTGGNKPIAEYGFVDFLQCYLYQGEWNLGFATPILSPMWYVRNLMVFCLVAPAIYYALKYLKWALVLLFGIWWISTPGDAFTQSSLFFFCLGASVKINGIDILNISPKAKKIFLVLYCLLFLADYLVHTEIQCQYPLLVHRLNLIASIYAVLLVGERISRDFHWNNLMAGSSFFIYAMHYPVTMALRKATVRLLPTDNGLIAFALYIASIVIVTALCLFVYSSMKKICPTVLNVLTGSRN